MQRKKQSKWSETYGYTKADVLHPVEVHWIDSSAASGWHHTHKECDLKCTSIGYRLRSKEDRVVLIQSTSDQCIDNILEIPMVAVTKIRKL